MDAKIEILLVMTFLIALKDIQAVPLTTSIPTESTVETETAPHLPAPCLKLLNALLGNHPNATPGPDEVLADPQQLFIHKRRHLLKEMGPIFAAHPAAQNSQPIPISIHTYSDNSPVNVAKDTNGAFSIHVSTKIDFGSSAALLNIPQGSVLGPLVFNNNFQFQLAEAAVKLPPATKDYYQYNDDEDYYVDEGSGQHPVNITVEPVIPETTESGSAAIVEI